MGKDILELSGNLDEIRFELRKHKLILDRNETSILLDFIVEKSNYLSSNEIARKKMKLPNPPTGCMGMMTPNYTYFISIKKLSLLSLIFLADKTVTHGLIEKILNCFGFSSQLFFEIEEENGEKCIVKETILYNDKIGNKNVLEQFNGECCNNDLKCRFKVNGCCKCTPNHVQEIYEKLMKKGVFSKIGENYKLNL